MTKEDFDFLVENYLNPAKVLIADGRDGCLFSACLILLSAIDEISQIKNDVTESDHNLFEKTWLDIFPIVNQKTACKKYELYPMGASPEKAAEIVWYIFRCRIAHNGGKIKDKNVLEKLGEWKDQHHRFVVVDRRDEPDIPVFCLNPADEKGDVKITLDVGKISQQLEQQLTGPGYRTTKVSQPGALLISVVASAANK